MYDDSINFNSLQFHKRMSKTIFVLVKYIIFSHLFKMTIWTLFTFLAEVVNFM